MHVSYLKIVKKNDSYVKFASLGTGDPSKRSNNQENFLYESPTKFVFTPQMVKMLCFGYLRSMAVVNRHANNNLIDISSIIVHYVGISGKYRIQFVYKSNMECKRHGIQNRILPQFQDDNHKMETILLKPCFWNQSISSHSNDSKHKNNYNSDIHSRISIKFVSKDDCSNNYCNFHIQFGIILIPKLCRILKLDFINQFEKGINKIGNMNRSYDKLTNINQFIYCIDISDATWTVINNNECDYKLKILNTNMKTHDFSVNSYFEESGLKIGDTIDICIDYNYNPKFNQTTVDSYMNSAITHKYSGYSYAKYHEMKMKHKNDSHKQVNKDKNNINKDKHCCLYFMKNKQIINEYKPDKLARRRSDIMYEIVYKTERYQKFIAKQIEWKNKFRTVNGNCSIANGKMPIDLSKYDFYYALSCQICDCDSVNSKRGTIMELEIIC